MKKENLLNIKNLWLRYKNFLKLSVEGLSKWRKIVFIVLGILLSGYIVFTRFTVYFEGSFSIVEVLVMGGLSFLYMILAFNVLIFLCSKLKDKHIKINSLQEKLDMRFFFVSFLICFIILAITLLAYYPGGISPDNANQWLQVQSFTFNDWHPVLHTFLIYLATRIYNNYTFVIFLQIVIFSLGVGYLISTLRSWGFSKVLLVIVEFLIILNPFTRNIMMYAWKDTALTIFVLILLVGSIDIYLSHGEWLRKSSNVIWFGVCVALTTIIRHNALFYTIPLLILVCILYFKQVKKIIILLFITASVFVLIKGPLYSFLKVEYPHNTYGESVGLPMTILSDVMKKNPSALTSETKAFMNEIASDELWQSTYSLGNYNSIKSHAPTNKVVESVPLSKFGSMVFNTIKSDPKDSLIAVRSLTSIVWSTKGSPNAHVNVGITPKKSIGYKHVDTIYTKIGDAFVLVMNTASNLPVLNFVFKSIGAQILALMLVCLFALYKHGFRVLMLVVPALVYDLGTMLLLSGNDYRLFNFNMVITIPICLVLLTERNNKVGKKIVK